MEITVRELTPEEQEIEDYCPDPSERSTILFEVEYVDGEDWGIYECQYEGGAADYENCYGCGLTYIIKDFIDVSQIKEGEWYVIEGFTTSFSRDYYGEVDAWHDFENFRIATIYDRLYFGV